MSIYYEIKIGKDSCFFSGVGYKTFFTDLCSIDLNIDTATLYFLTVIDGDEFSDHSDKREIGKLFRRHEKYFFKSDLVANKEWNYGMEIEIVRK